MLRKNFILLFKTMDFKSIVVYFTHCQLFIDVCNGVLELCKAILDLNWPVAMLSLLK